MSADTPLQVLEHGAVELGIPLSPAQLAQFDRYLAELQKWNQRVNLTGATTLHDVVTRHMLDSLAGLLVLQDLPSGSAVADLGSGAGFPGLPIKIARPDLHMTLIEPREKRAAFLTTVFGLLGLQGVTVVEATVSGKRPSKELINRFPCVLTRAVGDPLKTKALAAPLVTKGGLFVMWASKEQAARASEFVARRYRVPYTDLTHALLLWRKTH